MKAVQFKNGKIFETDRPKPSVGKDEILIKTSMAGICNTDIELLSGYYDFSGIPGHEFVGVIEQADANPDWIGRRVAVDINRGCGVCPVCRTISPRHCPEREVFGIKKWDGAFAEYVSAPVDNIHFIDDEVSDIEAVFAEPLAAALQIAQQVHLKGRGRTAVLGDGKLGLLIALSLSCYTPNLVLIGRHEEKLRIARDQGVATMLTEDMGQTEQSTARAGAFDVVVDATGAPGGINAALTMVRPQGVVVAKTTSHLPSTIDLAFLVVNEITIIGSRCGHIPHALDFLKKKRIDVRPLVDKIFPFDRFKDAFHYAGKKGAGKVLIEF